MADLKKLSLIVFITFVLFEVVLRVVEQAFPDTRSFYYRFNISPDDHYWKQMINSATENGYVGFDEITGWGINPNKASRDSQYVSNSIGIRSNTEFTEQKHDGVLRIAVFGDSYTHGDGVSNDETWSHYMEQWLNENGIIAEVMNFGVAGYGMDQAYLRYKEKGSLYNPDIVLFGFQLENFWRNLNIFRPNLYLYSGIPFSKPRAFIQNDSLKFANSPVFRKDSLWFFIENEYSDRGPLKYEYFNHNSLKKDSKVLHKLYTVKVFSGLWSNHEGNHEEKYSESEQGKEVMLKLLSSFEEEVNENGADFIVGQLPNLYEVQYIQNYEEHYESEYVYDFLSKFNHIRSDTLLPQQKIDKIFNGHYTSFGNKLIGNYFAEYIKQNLKNSEF